MENGSQAAPGSESGNPLTGEPVIDQVRRALENIEYGSVLIKVHQGQVVGIEISTKLRLEA